MLNWTEHPFFKWLYSFIDNFHDELQDSIFRVVILLNQLPNLDKLMLKPVRQLSILWNFLLALAFKVPCGFLVLNYQTLTRVSVNLFFRFSGSIKFKWVVVRMKPLLEKALSAFVEIIPFRNLDSFILFLTLPS